MRKMGDNQNNDLKHIGSRIVDFLGKTKNSVVKMVDQNDDGTFNSKDLGAIVDKATNSAKDAVDKIKINLDQRKQENDLKSLKPVFVSDLNNNNFFISKLIRLTKMDTKHAESKVCQGSIGYKEIHGGLEILNIYRDNLNLFDLSFFPNKDSELYYVDPSDRNKYIDLEKYFVQLKQERISELERIAYDLGAKHFKVIYKEQNTSSEKNNINQKNELKKRKNKVDIDVKINESTDEFCFIEIAAQSDFVGHKPKKPLLRYLKDEPHISNLIEMRMNEDPITHKKMEINFIESSGIKINDAIKIDMALKAMKFQNNTSIVKEVKKESRRLFEYEIDF